MAPAGRTQQTRYRRTGFFHRRGVESKFAAKFGNFVALLQFLILFVLTACLRGIGVMPGIDCSCVSLQLWYNEPYSANFSFENAYIIVFTGVMPLNMQRRFSMQPCKRRPNEAMNSVNSARSTYVKLDPSYGDLEL